MFTYLRRARMKYSYLFHFLLACFSISASPMVSSAALQEITIANFDRHSPACQVQVPETIKPCVSDTCELVAPKGSTLSSILVSFSCLPTESPTGFENPPGEVKLISLKANNATGYMSLIDDAESSDAERKRELSFCLFGKTQNVCGYATTLLLKDGKRADAAPAVRRFIQGIVLDSPSETLPAK